MGWFIVYIKGSQVRLFHVLDVLQSLKIAFVIANSADPDEMLHYAAFHLGLHNLPKYGFRVFHIQRVKLVNLIKKYLIGLD